ncbi:MAG: peptide chain release factor 2, partial [Tepidisphaeraceae bacterium]
MGAEGFWDNPDAAKSIVAEIKTIKASAEPIEEMVRGIDDARAMYELGAEAGDQSTIEEADRELH